MRRRSAGPPRRASVRSVPPELLRTSIVYPIRSYREPFLPLTDPPARISRVSVLRQGGFMTHSFARMVIGGLALFAGSGTLMTASTVHQPVSNVDILVGGTPQRRYLHDGRLYVEAVKGREYAIRLRNPYGVRVAVALSVDGLNTIDARHTTAFDARKWVLGPYETLTISGWQTSRTEARRFEFTTEE